MVGGLIHQVAELSDMPRKVKSMLLVLVQFVTAGAIVLTPEAPLHQVQWSVIVACIAFGVWAIASMRLRHFHILPDTTHRSRLVTSGPYGLVRHPMYTSLLIATLALIVHPFPPAWWRVCLWVALAIDLWIKLRVEERQLLDRFPEYAAYAGRVKRLLPWLI